MIIRKAPTTWNSETRTVEAVIATASPVRRSDRFGDFAEVLLADGADLSVLNSNAPVLNSHQQYDVADVLGQVERAWVDGGKIMATLRLSDRPEVQTIVEDIASGDIAAVSIGYDVTEWLDTTDAEGKRVRTAAKWTPREVSFVAVPADPNARTRSNSEQLETRDELLGELRSRSNIDLTVRTTMTTEVDFVRAAGEALYARHNPAFTVSAEAKPFVGMSVLDVARESLTRASVPTLGMSSSTLIQRALTTSDFPQALSGVMHMSLKAGYSVPASGVRSLSKASTAVDFRAKQIVDVDDALTLEKVGEHGEFKEENSFLEQTDSYKIATFGRIVSLSRQLIINDQLGAVANIVERLGRACQAFEAKQIVALLNSNPVMGDSVALFHANHGNLATAGTAITIAALSAARLAMRKQVSLSGNLVGVEPKYLVVAPEKETEAEQILAAIYAAKQADVNPIKLSLVVDPYLSGNAWYVMAGDLPAIEYSHLAGEGGPVIESRVGFEVDGVQYKVRLDFGAGAIEHRGAYKNPGA